VRWCTDGKFLAIFWVLHVQPAAYRTFQTCILNSHYGHTTCTSMVDIQFVTAEIRRGTTTTQLFHGPFSGTTRVSRCQKRTSDFMVQGRLTEADTLTIWLGATPSGLTSAHLHHPPIFFTGQMPFLPPN